MEDKKYYFQDNPVEDYENDYIGFEEEVNMIKEGIESDSRIIGLISDYGSGKSTIIKLLKGNIDQDKYDIININLFDPNGKNNSFEAHKRLLVQLAYNKFKNNKKKLSYVIKRLNPNYKSIDISTKSAISLILIVISIFLFSISFLYNNNLLHYLNFIANTKYSIFIPTIKELCKLSGIIGFFTFLITVLKSDFVCNYLNKDASQELNEFDLIEIAKEIIDDDKNIVLVIEDLDRLKEPTEIEQFIKELNVYYSNINEIRFIIAVTPDEFLQMSKRDPNIKDNKYKPFNLVINLPSIKNSDYEIILKKLLKSKEELLNKLSKFNLDESIEYWTWLSFGKKLNIRRLKHRINDTIHLYKTLCKRFEGRYVEIKTCIAITYLKDEYETEYNDLIVENDNGKFLLKEIIEEYIANGDILEKDTDIRNDIFELLKGDYIDYNIEMYCYNYSKYNEIFDSNEFQINHAYIKNQKYLIDDKIIYDTLNKNDDCLKRAIDKRNSLNIGIPSNVFDSKSIINYIIDTQSEEFLKLFYDDMLQIDFAHIKITKDRLLKMVGTSFYKEDNVEHYIETIAINTVEKNSLNSIEKSRIILLDIFSNNTLLLKKLYGDEYPMITSEEIKLISNKQCIFDLINFDKIDDNNLDYLIENIDLFYDKSIEHNIINFADSLNENHVDYFIKNCKSLSKLDNVAKKEMFENNFEYIDVSTYEEISKLTINMNCSFEKLEQDIILMYDNNNIDKEMFRKFVNSLPNIHECTLNRLLKDDCDFNVTDLIINEYKRINNMYGYVKYITFRDQIIPSNTKKIIGCFEDIYKNENHIFDSYIKNSNNFIEYIKDNKIYKKYGNQNLMILRFAKQNKELLEYVLDNIETNEELNNYFKTIKKINMSDVELTKLIDNYKEKIKQFDENARNNFKKCMPNSGLKIKLSWIWR